MDMTLATSRRTDVDDVLDILSSPDDRDLVEVVQLASSICGAQAAGITIRRGDRYHVPITHGHRPVRLLRRRRPSASRR